MKITKRPWGEFKLFVKNKKCTVKLIEVNSGQALSLQKHQKREECWYFLTSGIVQIGNKRKKIKKGSIINIGKNITHRIIAGKNKIEVLEISFGEFKEGDEIRLEDKYGRK
jgi:mannose-6-phosphate isomerase-like protein (cupin superfamily)